MGFRRLVASCVVAGSVLVACSGGGRASSSSSAPTPPPVTLPTTPAGAQAEWLITAIARPPLTDADVRAHFDASFLAQVGPDQLNQVLDGAAGVQLVSIKGNQPSALVIVVSTPSAQQIQVALATDAQGLIGGLRLTPVTPPAPTTWSAVDAALRPLAPRVRLLVADVTNGTCQPLHGVDPAAVAPLGSAFKLYVLDALATAVADGRVSWTQPLTIAAEQKSLPSGDLQNEPDGTRISVQDVAAKMISISDNTAADVLINLVGRPAVEDALSATGTADPSRDRPFLTTRELFELKLDQWPTLAERYIAANDAGRRALLATTIDPAPLPSATMAGSWRVPRDIDNLEWFASANDICHVYTSLAALSRRSGLSPLGDLLKINDGGLRLDPAQWQTTWFKGGSEPGVLTLNYLATTRTGHSYVVTVLAENPSAPIGETSATPVMLSAITGAFTLAAGR